MSSFVVWMMYVAVSIPSVGDLNYCKLHGNMRFVLSGGDYRVYILPDSRADVTVKLIHGLASLSGEWRVVPDGWSTAFTVQVVDRIDSADFTIRFSDVPGSCLVN